MKYFVHFEIGSKNDGVAMPEKCYTISQGCIVVFFYKTSKNARALLRADAQILHGNVKHDSIKV